MASRNNSDDVNADSNKKAEEKLISATELKLEGNNFYGQKNYKEAVRRYHRYILTHTDILDYYTQTINLNYL